MEIIIVSSVVVLLLGLIAYVLFTLGSLVDEED